MKQHLKIQDNIKNINKKKFKLSLRIKLILMMLFKASLTYLLQLLKSYSMNKVIIQKNYSIKFKTKKIKKYKI